MNAVQQTQTGQPGSGQGAVWTGGQDQPRGRLTIFLGYAPGVGKTYAMLEAARQQQLAGRDVVAGLIECHGQEETRALQDGLETLPTRAVESGVDTSPQLDVDAVLIRRPGLVLVDDLARTVGPGSRHDRRWQEVEEIVAAGIDVYTTVNVHHVESLNDVVRQITGIRVRETVPDSLFDRAAAIMLVDIPPETLIERQRQGRIVFTEHSQWMAQQLFRPGNLIALRELALRLTAARVDDEMRTYMQARAIAGPWPATERLLVCASGSPFSEQLIRTTRRLADELKAPWFTVYVETPSLAREQQENRERVWHDLRLAESLGAQVATLTAASAPRAIVDYAKRHNVTRIVVGKPTTSRWLELLHPPIVDQIIRLSDAIHVHVVSFKKEFSGGTPWLRPRRLGSWSGYLVSLGLVAVATGLSFLVRPHLAPINLVMVYLLAVVLAAVRFGRRPAMLTAALGVLAFDFFFITPRWSFTVADTEYLFTFLGLFIVGLVISTLVAKARDRAEALRQRELQTESLYYLSRDLAAAAGREAILEAAVKHVSESMQAGMAILTPQEGHLQVAAASEGLTLSASELEVAGWVLRNLRPAGQGTGTHGAAALLYLPLHTVHQVFGVLGIRLNQASEYVSHAHRRLLDAFVTQLSLALERVHLAEQAEQAHVLQARERLERALLNSISHDLRTPLVSIIGALSSLGDETVRLPEANRKALLSGAWDEAERLNRFVGNLLDMTRLEAGELHLHKEPCDVQDLIGCALAALDRQLQGRLVEVQLAENLDLVGMDMVLMNQVLVNLLENAVKYTPADGPIAVEARIEAQTLVLEVLDHGPGIAEAELDRVFEKFHRLPVPEGVRGTGLGLSICKGIVEAHGGTIRAENRPGGGLRVVCNLPL